MTQAMHQILAIEDEPGIRGVLARVAGGGKLPLHRGGYGGAGRDRGPQPQARIFCWWTSDCPMERVSI